MDTTESRPLVLRAQSGDASALDALLAQHLPGLRAYIRLRCGPALRARESASDIAQSACRDVLENLDRFQWNGEAGFKAWLYTTALRKIADRAEYWGAQKRDAKRDVPLELLAAGGSQAPDVLLGRLGVAIDDAAFWDRGFAVLEDLLAELEATLD